MQINLNHARRADDLLRQVMDERDSGVALISEPYRIPAGNPQWVGSPDGSAAITWRRARHPMPCTSVATGTGFAIAKWGETLLVSVYLSPALSVSDVEERLDELTRHLNAVRGAPIIIGGDFNARAAMWGSSTTNTRGRLVIDWASANRLVCLNRGNVSTCIRPQGESIVDLTWASPEAVRAVSDWEVLDGVESLSDHAYIEVSLNVSRDANGTPPKRWSIKSLDRDRFVAALMVSAWPGANSLPREEENGALDDRVDGLLRVLTGACDVGMPRVRPRPRRATYWWSPQIAELREEAIRARRRW